MRSCVELAALAVARCVPPGKFIDGLGVERMAVARAHEDPVALAATAARGLFTTVDIDPTTIGPCVVGTGIAVDHSKPVAAYLHRLLSFRQALTRTINNYANECKLLKEAKTGCPARISARGSRPSTVSPLLG